MFFSKGKKQAPTATCYWRLWLYERRDHLDWRLPPKLRSTILPGHLQRQMKPRKLGKGEGFSLFGVRKKATNIWASMDCFMMTMIMLTVAVPFIGPYGMVVLMTNDDKYLAHHVDQTRTRSVPDWFKNPAPTCQRRRDYWKPGSLTPKSPAFLQVKLNHGGSNFKLHLNVLVLNISTNITYQKFSKISRTRTSLPSFYNAYKTEGRKSH